MSKKIIVTIVAVTGFAAGGWWLAKNRAPEAAHQHQLEKRTTAQGKVYYTCSMHPQVQQDQPGQCPICGMNLVKREQAAVSMAGAAETVDAERKPLYWYDPMHPDQHFDQPGKSPFMDMQLVPKYADADASAASAGIVSIDPRMAQNLGMRTAAVRSGSVGAGLEAVGSVMVDERRIVAVEARAAGWVERLEVKSVGDAVRRGQVVAGVYSPDLLAAQEELALARKLGDAAMIEAARTRLGLLGVSENRSSAQRRVGIVAPESGVVTELLVREGMQVTPGMPLMKLADLSKVWIVIEVPEGQGGSIVPGTAAEARLQSLPGQRFKGKVDYVYPVLDAQTRTLRARLAFDNPELALKPGMYAQVTLLGETQSAVTLVPSEAVIRTGTRNVVLVAEAEGRYRPVEVVLGPERANDIVIVQGLQVGQQVVTSGQFLIDSEASLLGAYNRMGAGDESPHPNPPPQAGEGTKSALPLPPLEGEGRDGGSLK